MTGRLPVTYGREMARQPRIVIPGGIYHVTARGNRGQLIFRGETDRRLFMWLLEEITTRFRLWIHAYCLMDNHFHLVIETPNADLSAGMERLNGRYAQAFNHGHGLNGHLFQGRFHAVLVESDGHLLELSRYLALNPVKAGLCPTPASWRWGSYRAVIGLEPPQRFLSADRALGYFDRDIGAARTALRRFVEDGVDRVNALSA